MGGQSELFEACIALLDEPDRREARHREAEAFLEAIGYLPRPRQDHDVQLENRRALLRLAARFDDAFLLPSPYAPGASFFGALVRPEMLGPPEHKGDPAGASGRGANLRQAFEGCVGEAAEYLSFLERTRDDLIERRAPGNPPVGTLSDWALSGLGLARAHTADIVDWVAARSLVDDATTYFPAELVLRRPERRRAGRRMAESTGVGAAATLEQAVYSGLMEVIERDAVALWWYGGRRAGSLPVAAEWSGELHDFQAFVRQDHKRRTWFLDLTGDLGVPVVAALSSADGGEGVVAGFASDLDLGTAARKAFLELAQMELAQSLALYKLRQMGARALKDMDRIWVERFRHLSVGNCPQLRPATDVGDAKCRSEPASLADVVTRLEAAGYTPYVVDLTREEIAIPVVRVIVPELQSVKPDWISERLRHIASENGVDVTRIRKTVSPI